jgi:type IV pilus assembly protein PilO
MALKSSSPSMGLSSMFEDASSQFKGLDFRQPGQWSPLPKLAAFVVAALVVVVLGWFALLLDANDELEVERAKEVTLKQDFRTKLAMAVNLSELRKQKLLVEEYVIQLEKQLPGKAEMDALLSDINQAGLGRGLQFELFRPGQVVVKDYYAELPIELRVSGRFHDIGSFAADVANLSRIVTLHDLSISVTKSGSDLMTMDATARTYRYLDAEEIETVRRDAVKKPKRVS